MFKQMCYITEHILSIYNSYFYFGGKFKKKKAILEQLQKNKQINPLWWINTKPKCWRKKNSGLNFKSKFGGCSELEERRENPFFILN